VLVRALRLTELGSGGSYMAFGPKTDDLLVERFRKGLEAVKANGTFALLQKKWF
jgi:polar amino acid transport system substrate-binding protein